MCSGITSASTASRAFAANFSDSLGLGLGGLGVTMVGLVFMAAIAAVNFRGVGESVKINVLLTVRRALGPLDHHRHRPVGDRRRHRRSVAHHDIQHECRRQRDMGRHRRHDARLLRHGRLRGFGQHGRGDARPEPHLSKSAAERPRAHRHHLRAGIAVGHRARVTPGAGGGRDAAIEGGAGGRARRFRWAYSASSLCSPSPTVR